MLHLARRTDKSLGGKIEEIARCSCFFFPPFITLMPSSAENLALHKATAMKENIGMMILQPPKGTSSSRFNLQAAMDLENNYELYASLHVS